MFRKAAYTHYVSYVHSAVDLALHPFVTGIGRAILRVAIYQGVAGGSTHYKAIGDAAFNAHSAPT